ncbi:HGGxSTG domain-containing protein [Novosphingobium sediminicola]|uniref:HGGxSTG domain-containing protein n=1 Tax=Novosphingobium sediminicola TaxID=563162 RepID=UPI003CCDFA1F
MRASKRGANKMNNQANNPMHPMEPLEARLAKAPRCLARTRSGKPCQSPAVKGAKRCRMHGGGKNREGRGSGAPAGNCNAMKHGARSAETRKIMAMVRAWDKLPKES